MNSCKNKIRSFAKYTLIILGLHKFFVSRREAFKHYTLQKARENSILSYKKRFNPSIFIETGTYKGEMLESMKSRFKKLYSVELGDKLYADAKARFAHDSHIEILHGDSGVVLPQILSQITEPALFWLDAHYSSGETARGTTDTPIMQELKAVLNHPIKNHVILIDDARDFTGKNDYPAADTIRALAESYGYMYELKNDNFRIYPKK